MGAREERINIANRLRKENPGMPEDELNRLIDDVVRRTFEEEGRQARRREGREEPGEER